MGAIVINQGVVGPGTWNVLPYLGLRESVVRFRYGRIQWYLFCWQVLTSQKTRAMIIHELVKLHPIARVETGWGKHGESFTVFRRAINHKIFNVSPRCTVLLKQHVIWVGSDCEKMRWHSWNGDIKLFLAF